MTEEEKDFLVRYIEDTYEWLNDAPQDNKYFLHKNEISGDNYFEFQPVENCGQAIQRWSDNSLYMTRQNFEELFSDMAICHMYFIDDKSRIYHTTHISVNDALRIEQYLKATRDDRFVPLIKLLMKSKNGIMFCSV